MVSAHLIPALVPGFGAQINQLVPRKSALFTAGDPAFFGTHSINLLTHIPFLSRIWSFREVVLGLSVKTFWMKYLCFGKPGCSKHRTHFITLPLPVADGSLDFEFQVWLNLSHQVCHPKTGRTQSPLLTVGNLTRVSKLNVVCSKQQTAKESSI